MRSLAGLPRGSIQKVNVPACVQAVTSILACAHSDSVKSKPTLLSNLGKLVQAQAPLRQHLRRDRKLQKHISDLFAVASAGSDLFTNPIDVSQLATAQLKLGQYSSEFWARIERWGLGTLSGRAFSNVVHAYAKLHQHCGAPRPSVNLQKCMWHALQERDHRLAAEMNSQNLSNIWWSFATLGMVVPAQTHDALQSATIRLAPVMPPQEVANIWWAFATLALVVSAQTHDALQSATVRLAPAMAPQSVANILWALGVQTQLERELGDGASVSDEVIAGMSARLLQLYHAGEMFSPEEVGQVHPDLPLHTSRCRSAPVSVSAHA